MPPAVWPGPRPGRTAPGSGPAAERGLEQQHRDRLGTAQPALGHVLVAEPERPPRHLRVVGQARRPRHVLAGQDVGDQPVGLDERPHDDLRHQRPHLGQQGVRGVRARPEPLLPGGIVPVHLLAHLAPVLLAVPEVELELQQVAQPGDLGPERPDRVGAVVPGPEHGQLAQRGIEQEVDQPSSGRTWRPAGGPGRSARPARARPSTAVTRPPAGPARPAWPAPARPRTAPAALAVRGIARLSR